jgi:glycosyltransferase involved in cell wall biosynthesis
MRTMSWVLLTGEYPPQRGGVADYTQHLAAALAADGDSVHVLAPPWGERLDHVDGITIHRLPDRYGPRSRAFLRPLLSAVPSPRAAVVQYVPQAFGMRGCNIPFAMWLRALRGYPLFIMFHEVSVTVRPDTPLKYRLQALATRIMASHAIGAADVSFVSTPAWEPLLHRLGSPRSPIDWTGIPSGIALCGTPAATARIRAQLCFEDGTLVLGHFGTYRERFSRDALRHVVPRVMRDRRRTMLFMGRGSERFAADLLAEAPVLAGRIRGVGELPAQALSDHLAACDLLIQPFEDGVTTRRSSVAAALALGVPVATTTGWATEALWAASAAVGLAPAASFDALADVVDQLTCDSAARTEMGERGRALYRQHFAIEHTVAALRRAGTQTTVAS